MEEKRKRRWLSFSVRTLLLAVAIVCVGLGWLMWQMAIVRERREILGLLEGTSVRTVSLEATEKFFHRKGLDRDDNERRLEYFRKRRISAFRTLLGDKSIVTISLKGDASWGTPLANRIAKAFPEAVIYEQGHIVRE